MLVACVKRSEYETCTRRAGELESQLEEANTRNQQLDERNQELTADNGRMTDRLRALGENVEELRAQSGQLSTDLESERRRLEECALQIARHESRLDKMREIVGRFRDMVASGRLRVKIVNGRLVLEMSSNILFGSGSADLSDEGEQTLAELGNLLRGIPDRHFQVAGHTDNEPIRRSRFANNWQLSTARALEVVEFLQQEGVQARYLSAAGYSEFAPVTTNDTEGGRAANRRIEVVLMPNLDELPDFSSLENEI
jgi:chemotaxis protein MotB